MTTSEPQSNNFYSDSSTPDPVNYFDEAEIDSSEGNIYDKIAQNGQLISSVRNELTIQRLDTSRANRINRLREELSQTPDERRMLRINLDRMDLVLFGDNTRIAEPSYDDDEEEEEDDMPDYDPGYSNPNYSISLDDYKDMSHEEILAKLIEGDDKTGFGRMRLMASIGCSGFKNLNQNTAIKLIKYIGNKDTDQKHLLKCIGIFDITDENEIYKTLAEVGVYKYCILNNLERFTDKDAFRSAFPDTVEELSGLSEDSDISSLGYVSIFSLGIAGFAHLLDLDIQGEIINYLAKHGIGALIDKEINFDESLDDYIAEKVLACDRDYIRSRFYGQIKNFKLSEATLQKITDFQEAEISRLEQTGMSTIDK